MTGQVTKNLLGLSIKDVPEAELHPPRSKTRTVRGGACGTDLPHSQVAMAATLQIAVELRTSTRAAVSSWRGVDRKPVSYSYLK